MKLADLLSKTLSDILDDTTSGDVGNYSKPLSTDDEEEDGDET